MLNCHFNLLNKLLLSFIILFICCPASANKIQDCQIDVENYTNLPISWPSNQHKESLDAALWLTIEQARDLSNNVVWVDIRTNLSQTNNRLDMLKIQLHQLEQKDFLFDKTVVLVGTGFDQQIINDTIKSLKKNSNFKHLFALLGGIRSWNQLKQQNLIISDVITPEEFLLGGKTINWQVITIGLTPQDIKTLPEEPIITFDLSFESNLVITDLIGNEFTNNDAFIRYVLITPNEQISLILKNRLNLAKSNGIVWLKGGLSDYQHYVKQQIQFINHKGKSLSKPCRLTL